MTITTAKTPFAGYSPAELAEYLIDQHQGSDPAWVLDQVMRILKGTPVHAGRCPDGLWRIRTGCPSNEYRRYICEIKEAGHTPTEGTPP